MKNCAIICEYNPMHTGHLYQLGKALGRFDGVICLMSGNFVQRAEPAVMERHVRARIALVEGASLVMELPVVYAVMSGERFAGGAIKTLAALKDIDSLVMGCEADDPALLSLAADIQTEESESFRADLTSRLAAGESYAAALAAATALEGKRRGADEETLFSALAHPNNLLCVEYIKAIKRNSLDIKPVFIKRVGNGHNALSRRGSYLSATALRELIAGGDFTAAAPYLARADEAIAEFTERKVSADAYERLALFALRSSSPEEIGKAFDCREGIEYRLYDCAMNCRTMGETLAAAKTKRYTMGRLKRIVLQHLLGITKDIMENEPYLPPRLLAVREDFKPYLAENGKKMIIRGEDMQSYGGEYYDKYFAIEKRAAAIYSSITLGPADLFAPRRIFGF